MTGKKVIAILAAGALLCGLAGCDKKDTGSSAPNSVQSVPQSVPESKPEAAQSSGTSSDNSVSSAPQRTVEIKPEITMDGQLISLPCKVNDIAGITLDTEDPLAVTPSTADAVEYSQVTFYLNDARGTIRLAGDCSEKTDLGEETVIGIELREGIPFSYLDVTSDSTMDEVIAALGEPDRSSDQNKSYFLRYYIDGDPTNYVDFGFNETHDKILVVRVYLLGKGSAPTANQTSFDFDEAVQNITLFEQKISLPCTIADFGNDFSLDDPSDILVFESFGFATSNLYYRGDIIGTVNLHDYKENDLPENKQIVSLSLGSPIDYGYTNEEERKTRLEAYGQFSGLIPLDFAGVSFTSTQNEIIDKLGVPTENIEDSTYGLELRTINYNISDSKGIYLFLADNKPYWIVITCE